MAALRVRKATSRDVGLLVRHRRGMWRDIGKMTEAQLDAGDPVYRRWIRARLKSGKAAGFIIDRAGEPAASGVLWIQEAQPRPGLREIRQGYLLSMYTEPAHRRKGLAAAIVRAAVAWAHEQGMERVSLHAAPLGRRVYERAGFERTYEMRLIFQSPRRRR